MTTEDLANAGGDQPANTDSTAAPEKSDKVETKANEDKSPSEAATEEGDKPDTANDAAKDDKDASEAAKVLQRKKQSMQERLNEVTHHRREAERRADRLAAELAQLKGQMKAPVADEYTDPNKLNADNVAYALDQREAQRLEREQKEAADTANRARQEAFRERVNEFRTTVDDFDSMVQALDPILSTESVEMIADLEEGPAVAYHLGKNPAEARRIENMAPREKAFALGKIAARLTTAPPKRVTAAPTPVNAVTGKTAGSSDDYSDMSMTEYARRRTQEIRAKSK